ncbi:MULTISPECIES: hypothetical protein [Sphingobium]|uniref:Antitoxin Xre/MbcA/ParS-like toxin-binding domain-containing protein n=1 Tax=Sphingobium tyrosinilyticum TaxID=2715436 RepID=A0ABV9EYY7_9SPHN|nr:hypothetical protein [Sphingobium sp. EP60837]ANI79912.1 hypothetical protein EP837_03528 [Sphingobium sp. EP60837]
MTEDAITPARPRRRAFVNRETRISPDQARRQGLITHLAFVLLGHEEAIRFLNTHNTSLGARPLDLAIGDPTGYSVVEDAVKLLARPATGGRQ